ncbi:MAG: hypothetical protein ACR2LL_05395 [Nitrosopumilus sp.]|uniref:hypothetical protein n=1 Tax=Nitrosopumilus sp. TaxID=2024843 RepID=UPI00292FCF0D|nr:hypothetical protein [Nitrosopumilus sp.]
MRLSIIVLIVVLAVGGIVISLGFTTSQEYAEEVPEISNQYEQLEKYKNELEKINQYNQKILRDLEEQIKNSDDVHLNQLNEELEVIKQVISENKAEIEKIVKELSEINNPSG